MGTEPLIQKLFALERAVGKVNNITLRTLIIEAEEAALALDREILQRLRTEAAALPPITSAALARDLATRGGTESGGGSGSRQDGSSIAFHRKSA